MKMYKNEIKVNGKPLTVVTIYQGGEAKQMVKIPVKQIHHIHIIDRSGSMSSHINKLVDQVQQTLELISENDLVSVIWFSSPGQYRTLVKGTKKSPELHKLLDSLRGTVGATCFSDPIKEVKAIIEELETLCPDISVTLFTDGQPVTPWSEVEEEKRSLDLVKAIKDKIIAFNCVGYGNYYSQDFLRNLSSLTEYGVFTHSSRIEEYFEIFKSNFERILGVKSERVHIEYQPNINCIYLTEKFTKMSNLETYLSRLDPNKNLFYMVSKDKEFSFIYNDVEVKSSEITTEALNHTMENFMYAYAYNLYYVGRKRESVEVLAALLDKALLDSHMNAFTFDECADHLSLLQGAVFNVSDRYKDGEAKANYLPAKDAFCVLDALNTLANGNAFYLPFHEKADEYERIGKKTTDTHNLFEMTKEEVISPFSDFVFNKEKANLSLRVFIPGTVKLNPKGAKEIGLPSEMEAHIWRSYTFIKDGYLNIKKCVAILPETVYKEIQSQRKICTLLEETELTKTLSHEYGVKYVLAIIQLKKLPVINASYNENVSAGKVFETCLKQLELECYQKYLNHYWKQFEANATAAQMKVGVFENLSADQIKFLEMHGVDKSGSYVGVENVRAKNEECDHYFIKTWAFTFKGVSSLPSVKDVTEKVKANKMTVSVEKMNEAHLKLLAKAKKEGIDLEAATVQTRDWLTQEKLDCKHELFQIRGELCALKMAKILNGDTFEGFTADNKQNLCYTHKDMTLYMKTDRVKEYFS